MEKNLVDFDYLVERLYAIIRDGEHVNQLEAIRILLTMQQPSQVGFETMPERSPPHELRITDETTDEELSAVIRGKPQRKAKE